MKNLRANSRAGTLGFGEGGNWRSHTNYSGETLEVGDRVNEKSFLQIKDSPRRGYGIAIGNIAGF